MPWISRASLRSLESSVELHKKHAEQRLREWRETSERANLLNRIILDLRAVSPEAKSLIQKDYYGFETGWDRSNLDIVLEHMKRKGTDKRAKEILKQFDRQEHKSKEAVSHRKSGYFLSGALGSRGQASVGNRDEARSNLKGLSKRS